MCVAERERRHLTRLMILARHLEHSNLFYDWIVSDELFKPVPMIDRGVEGIELAVFQGVFSELPHLFPKHFRFKDELVVGRGSAEPLPQILLDFFRITPAEFMHMFSPFLQSIQLFGGVSLHWNASPKEISYNIMHIIYAKKRVLN